METFSDIITAVQSDLTTGSESVFYDTDTIKLAINRAYKKSAGLFMWPETEDAKKTSTVIDQEYYDFPETWRTSSIWKLVVDSVDYGDPLQFRDYQYEKANSLPSGRERIWTVYGRQFFFYPLPTTNGNNNICVWGQKVVDSLSSLSEVTIFSYSTPECNDAIALEAVSILKNKAGQEQSGQFRSIESKQILISAWQKIQNQMKKYEKTIPMLEVPDFFGNGRQKTKIGMF